MMTAAVACVLLATTGTKSVRTPAEIEMLSSRARFMADNLVKQGFVQSPDLAQRNEWLKRTPGMKVISRIPTKEKIVSLTFDDGPYPGHTERILATLERENIKATFFLIGSRVDDNPELVREILRQGHEIANHTYFHPNLTWLSKEQVEAELLATSWTIRRHTGREVPLARPPGGQWNKMVQGVFAQLGYTSVLWTINPGDLNGADKGDIVKAFQRGLSPGATVLLHDYPEATHEALPEIIRIGKSRGYRFVRVGDVLPRFQPHPAPAPRR